MTRRLSSEFAESGESPGLVMWRVTNAWQAAQRAALRQHDLTHVQFVLLASLTWLDTAEPVTQKDLAEHAGTDPMMTSQVLRMLEKRSLVERRAHPTDSRARSVVVTVAGADLANRAVTDVEAVDRWFFEPLGKRRSEFTALLGRLAR
jgi:DNA-binding MarR family transcriptional regulator